MKNWMDRRRFISSYYYAASPLHRPLRLEQLEDRTAQATINVTSVNDGSAVDGTVSQREAIQSISAGTNINADMVAVGPFGSQDTITFNISASGTV